MINLFLSMALVLATPFVPYKVYFPPEGPKSSETLEKEAAKKKYRSLLAKELNEKFGFYVEPGGWLISHDEIYLVNFYLQHPKRIETQEEIRELMVRTIAYIYSFLNDDPEIRPFLLEYPFKVENIHISVSFTHNLQRDLPAWVHANYNCGKINYTYEYEAIKVPSETFEEAQAKVLEAQCTQ